MMRSLSLSSTDNNNLTTTPPLTLPHSPQQPDATPSSTLPDAPQHSPTTAPSLTPPSPPPAHLDAAINLGSENIYNEGSIIESICFTTFIQARQKVVPSWFGPAIADARPAFRGLSRADGVREPVSGWARWSGCVEGRREGLKRGGVGECGRR
ncbi:hypothetical protein QJS04_geneDACA012748 [Acorus gramineus]|uniref:Uncharacterized protein n=1 Tax=Acorus gramineus TaxID=55184 RepID=A0AAV8ZY57_ACOGR|nr:hypothetical protein QJS04_geneDACA012748 [Acorus gramineus]